MSNWGYRSSERGIALITVLMLVAIIASIAAIMLMREQTMLDRADAFSRQQQLSALEISSNQWAQARLSVDESLLVDTLDEPWLELSAVSGVGFASLRQQMLDASARINLNNLVLSGRGETTQVLVQALFLELGLSADLVFPLTDYIDEDTEAGEIDELQAYGRALPNQPLVSIDELLSVPGFTAAQVNALRPHVSALPWFLSTNLNTTSDTVINAITQALLSEEGLATGPSEGTPTQADSDSSNRTTYNQVSDFTAQAQFADVQASLKSSLESLLAVKSGGILLVSSAQLPQGDERSWITVIKRQGSQATAIYKLPAFMDDLGVLAQLKSTQSARPNPEL